MAFLPVQTTFNIDLQFETAPFHYRFFAWLIDVIILYIYIQLVSYFLSRSFNWDDIGDFGLAEIFLMVPILLYHLMFEIIFNGQSIGKMILGIKVVSLTGKSATLSQYILRWLSRVLDFGFLYSFIFMISGEFVLAIITLIASISSFIVFIVSKYNQRLGDLVAGTSVILKKAPYKLADTIFKNINVHEYVVTFADVMKLSDRDINIINSILINNHKSKYKLDYIHEVSNKIKTALSIETSLSDIDFLETLLNDYNYLSRK